MVMGPQAQTDWWNIILRALKFGARIPAALLIIAAVAMVSFLSFFALWCSVWFFVAVSALRAMLTVAE